MALANAKGVDLGRLSLRCVPGKGADRGFIVGGSGYGKSKLADFLGLDWDRRYWNKKGKRLILDRKPRYQAEWMPNGLRAKRLYKRWDHGSFVAGSVLVHAPEDLDLAWSLGYHVAICQGDSDADIPRMLDVADRFHKTARASQPQLLYVDEMLYFFSTNGMPKGGRDTLKTYAVGGRERGQASLFASQRTKGFPSSIMEELNRLYFFLMDYVEDCSRLQEMGAPITLYREQGKLICPEMPAEEYEFNYWTKQDRRVLYGPYKLAL